MVINTNEGTQYGAFNYSTWQGQDWRIFPLLAGTRAAASAEDYVLQVTGDRAGVKAKAIVMILNGSW
jgi:hypothetical protein